MDNIAPTPAMRTITGHLAPEEVQELQDILVYLGEKVPAGHLPEGSIAALFNKASPRVREVLSMIDQTMETPRVAPFAPKLSEADIAEGYGLDPQGSLTVKAALDGQHVMQSLQARMGSDKDLPDTPPSMTDVLSAAYDKHGGRP